MSSSTKNDLTKWSDEQLHENDDDDEKSTECRHWMKVWKEAECWGAEEEVKQKAEEEAKPKAEVKVWRRAEMEAKACAEEVAWVQSSVMGPSKGKQPKAAVSRVAEVMEKVGGLAPCYGCWGAGVACEMKAARADVAEEVDKVMSPWARKKKVQTQSPVADNKQDENEAAEESEKEHDTLDLEFALEEPEVGSEEEFEEEEVAEAAEEREALKGWSEEEAEVDESV
ncbi:hypothetical protein PAXRUDRAFT_15119 [Paxillus rubicundulus Ve08.2h10]|uniref:Uncharacterized protein n=1 Tax=Paxillus rubicundulus Ve08.2h10 TaxID=930991 RepID=A0A0D0DJ73_9AGAM|nr:hypothetical protein PAXRUDRAFT_15119 [Paxillus rubicundulus Ve08.2h10]